jgi:CRISPR system Cascade subunit CasC
MKLIELHILQSFPVSCLNRDDVGAPKTAVFGGASRARISSQCLKRAIRLLATELQPSLYAAKRSRLFVPEITRRLGDRCPNQTEPLAKCAAHYLGKLDPKDNAKVKTLMFLSKEEYQLLADMLADLPPKDREELCAAVAQITPEELDRSDADDGDEGDAGEVNATRASARAGGRANRLTAKQFTKKVSSVLKSVVKKKFARAVVKDAADIAVFGRMVANDHSLFVEGAGLFSHALSTHRAENDIDFFAAVDDLQEAEQAGAGMTGTLEFTSATYYRYAGLNLDLLGDADHPGLLSVLSTDERRTVVDAFLRAALLAVPGARKNSMNAHTLPGYVLGLVKDKGQPVQLVNAFETPVFSKNGLMELSVSALNEHHEHLVKTWGVEASARFAIPEISLDEFCKEIVAHVD